MIKRKRKRKRKRIVPILETMKSMQYKGKNSRIEKAIPMYLSKYSDSGKILSFLQIAIHSIILYLTIRDKILEENALFSKVKLYLYLSNTLIICMIFLLLLNNNIKQFAAIIWFLYFVFQACLQLYLFIEIKRKTDMIIVIISAFMTLFGIIASSVIILK